MNEWEDFSYSGNIETEPSEPTCWRLEIPVLDHTDIEIKVHRRSDFRIPQHVWWLSCANINLGPIQLWASDVKEAQREALMKIHEIINAMDTAVANAALSGNKSSDGTTNEEDPQPHLPPDVSG